MTRPTKMSDGRLLLPVWKPERVFNLSATEITIEDPHVTEGPKKGRTYMAPVVVQLWMAPKEGDDYEAIAEVVLAPGKYRAFAFTSYINAYGFEEVTRVPETAQVVGVTNAYDIEVSSLGPEDPDTKPQIDLKIHGAFL